MTKSIFEYIKILLPLHKCVTLPGFGAFILNKEENNVFGVDERIMPPSYSISFNSRLQHDDGTLSSYIQSIQGTTYERASKELATVVRDLRSQLLIDKEVVCSTMGKIELLESSIVFTQNRDYISPTHFGLYSVGLTSISVISESIAKETKTISLRKRLITISASVAVVLLLALPSTNITDSVADSNNQQAGYLKSLVVSNNAMPEVEEQPEIQELVAEVKAEELSAEIEIAPVAEVVVAKSTMVEEAEPKRVSERRYYLVIGGESSAERAERTLGQFKKEGFETAQIVESPERHRIYIESFDNLRQAENRVVEFRKENPKYHSAWVHSQRN